MSFKKLKKKIRRLKKRLKRQVKKLKFKKDLRKSMKLDTSPVREHYWCFPYKTSADYVRSQGRPDDNRSYN